MPNSSETIRRQLRDLAQAHGRDMVDVALRESLTESGLSRDALNERLLRGSENEVNLIDVQRRLEELAKIGRPLPPGPVQGGGNSIIGARIGIKGNPIDLDQGYQGGWHFAQSNGWDAWFTITPRPSGGYFIDHPAMRLTGQDGPAHIANGTTAGFDANMNLVFDLNWGGHVGRYECSLDQGSRTIHGKTFDVTNAGAKYDFVGTVMEEAADRPGNGQGRRMPMIALAAVPNTNQNGYNVTISGSGFVPGEVVTIEGRAKRGNAEYDWTPYTSATVDAFGRFSCEPFGISKPADTKYSFRAVSESSGYSAEVGF